MKTLHLNLTRKWYKMILLGIKKEEYRALSTYYVSLLFNWRKSGLSRSVFLQKLIDQEDESLWSYLKDFSTITFSNGYATDRPQFVIEFKGIRIKKGNQNWGADKDTKYFTLLIGNILNKAD